MGWITNNPSLWSCTKSWSPSGAFESFQDAGIGKGVTNFPLFCSFIISPVSEAEPPGSHPGFEVVWFEMEISVQGIPGGEQGVGQELPPLLPLQLLGIPKEREFPLEILLPPSHLDPFFLCS